MTQLPLPEDWEIPSCFRRGFLGGFTWVRLLPVKDVRRTRGPEHVVPDDVSPPHADRPTDDRTIPREVRRGETFIDVPPRTASDLAAVETRLEQARVAFVLGESDVDAL